MYKAFITTIVASVSVTAIAAEQKSPASETITVYAPVPVPVNGNTFYSSKDIERLPSRNGNISDLLRSNPAVRLDTNQSTSMNQGDIRPEKLSFHGASPYQNAFLIDGVSATNNLNPANDSDSSNATNISGTSQGYYLDISLLDNIRVYDSLIPVEFGRFNGGVIDARVRRFNEADNSISLNYRTTRSSWLKTYIDSKQQKNFSQGSKGNTYYSPSFNKNFYSLAMNQAFTDNIGMTLGLSRRQSDIHRADYVSAAGEATGRVTHQNIIDTLLAKFSYLAGEANIHDVSIKYSGSRRQYNTSTFPESGRNMGNRAWGIAWDMQHRLENGQLQTTLGWDHLNDYTRHDQQKWYTEHKCSYPGISGKCTRGGLGYIAQSVDNLTAKARIDWHTLHNGEVAHKPYFGVQYLYSMAQTQRYNTAESYQIQPNGSITNHSIYHQGKGSLNLHSGTIYLADSISWKTVSLVPGIRYDYDSYLKNHNISPRFLSEWDVMGNQQTFLSAGYNRYYGGNILDMGLRDIRNSWTESAGNKTLTRYQQLKTPYNDELAFGIQQRLADSMIIRVNYVWRYAADQVSKYSTTDKKSKTTITTYNNLGKTQSHSVNMSLQLTEPLQWNTVQINPQLVISYIRNKGNISLNKGYEDSNTIDDHIVYNGKLTARDKVPVVDFNNPLQASFNLDFTHQPTGIVWSNTISWQQARNARIIISKKDAEYIRTLADYQQYADKKLDNSINWDSRLSWTPVFFAKRNLTVSMDMLNILNSKTTVNSTVGGVSAYASGRQFWLDIGVKF